MRKFKCESAFGVEMVFRRGLLRLGFFTGAIAWEPTASDLPTIVPANEEGVG